MHLWNLNCFCVDFSGRVLVFSPRLCSIEVLQRVVWFNNKFVLMPSVYSKVEQYHEYASFYSETFNRHIQKAYFTELSSTICSLYIFYRHFFCIFLTFSAWWSFRSIGALVVFKKRSESFIRHLLSTRVDSVLYGRVVVFSGPLRARTVSPI